MTVSIPARFAALALLTAPLWLSGSARADCADPQIVPSSRRVQAGDEVQIDGEFWTDTCDDVGGPPTGGCFGIGADDGFDEGHPVQDISLRLAPEGGGEAVDLGEVDAGDDFTFSVDVTIPDLEPGRYRLVADSAAVARPVGITIEKSD